MNELDPTLARLFAEQEPGADAEAFVAAVHRRIARRRKLTRAAAAGLVGSAAAALIGLAPHVLLLPAQLVHGYLSSPLPAAAALLIAAGLTWWSRYGEA